MHWTEGLASLRRASDVPSAAVPSNRFGSSLAYLLGMSSCWNNHKIPTGCWPTGIEGTCFETGNPDQRERARDPRRAPGGRSPCCPPVVSSRRPPHGVRHLPQQGG